MSSAMEPAPEALTSAKSNPGTKVETPPPSVAKSNPGTKVEPSSPPSVAKSNPGTKVEAPSTNPKSSPGSKIEHTGATLREVRESKGLSLKQLAESTRISVTGLRAIEEEDYERLPDARIYVRGYVICVAQELGLDPDLVAKSYLPRWDRWYEVQESAKKPHHR